jgi:PAS domain-containing protein
MAHPEAVLRQRQQALEEAQHGASCGHRYELALGVTRRWHEMSVYRRKDQVDGAPRYLMVVRDITHQKALEDELRVVGKVFESQQALMLIDTERTVVRVNRACAICWAASARPWWGTRPGTCCRARCWPRRADPSSGPGWTRAASTATRARCCAPTASWSRCGVR